MRTEASILHVDLDAFFASVEQLLDPALQGKPVIVGGLGGRGVVSTASYEARPFGVHSAMSITRARQLCPQAIFVSPNFEKYSPFSKQVMAILRAITPLVEPISSDEAFMDVSGARRTFRTGPKIAKRIRTQITQETGLTASIGVSTCKLVSKLASNSAKPNGLLIIEPGKETEFVHALPVQRLWGVGPATFRKLERFGVVNVGDLAALPRKSLVSALGSSLGNHLHELAWCRDDSPVHPEREAKSIGQEETFPVDVFDLAQLRTEIVKLSDAVARQLRKTEKVARTVQLKLKYPSFQTLTRSKTVAKPTTSSELICSVALTLLDTIDLTNGVRLIGVSVHNLEQPTAIQESLLTIDETQITSHEIDHAVDSIRDRFGGAAIHRGAAGGPQDMAKRGRTR